MSGRNAMLFSSSPQPLTVLSSANLTERHIFYKKTLRERNSCGAFVFYGTTGRALSAGTLIL